MLFYKCARPSLSASRVEPPFLDVTRPYGEVFAPGNHLRQGPFH